jgi:hypothetical protein
VGGPNTNATPAQSPARCALCHLTTTMTKRNKYILLDLGIVIFYLCYVFYIFKSPDVVEVNELVEVTGQLNAKPIYDSPTGDNVPSINFKISNNSSTYTIKSCQLQQISIDNFLNSNLLDTLKFSIKKDISLLEKINSEIEVFQLKDITTNHTYFSLTQVNSCKKIAWKEFSLVTLLLIGALIFSFFTKKKESEPVN